MYDYTGDAHIHGIERLIQYAMVSDNGNDLRTKIIPLRGPHVRLFQARTKRGWFSELVPNIAGIADEITLVKSVHTEAINHDPAITAINTGVRSLGSHPWALGWIGKSNKNLPATADPKRPRAIASPVRPFVGSALPSKHQGVKFEAPDPVLYLSNPKGVSQDMRRSMLDGIAKINQAKKAESGDPEIDARIAQYEMAYRMQTVPNWSI